MKNIEIVNPKNELLNKINSAATKTHNIIVLNTVDNKDNHSFVVPQIYRKYIELENDINVLKNMLTNDRLSNEEKKAVNSGIEALLSKQKLFNMETQQKRMRGIQKAAAKGKYKGRKPVKINDKLFSKEYARYMHREITKGELANILHVSRPTLDKIIKNHIDK